MSPSPDGGPAGGDRLPAPRRPSATWRSGAPEHGTSRTGTTSNARLHSRNDQSVHTWACPTRATARPTPGPTARQRFAQIRRFRLCHPPTRSAPTWWSGNPTRADARGRGCSPRNASNPTRSGPPSRSSLAGPASPGAPLRGSPGVTTCCRPGTPRFRRRAGRGSRTGRRPSPPRRTPAGTVGARRTGEERTGTARKKGGAWGEGLGEEGLGEEGGYRTTVRRALCAAAPSTRTT